jgi:hypothetical protein
MPSNMTLNFRDPRTGTQHQLRGETIDSVTNEGPRAADKMQADPTDGKLDLFVRDEYSRGHTTHLRVALGDLEPGVAEALQAAIRDGGKNAFNLRPGNGTGWGRAVSADVRSDVAVELAHATNAPIARDPSVPVANNVTLSESGALRVSGGGDDLSARAAGLYAAAEATDTLREGDKFSLVPGITDATRGAMVKDIGETLALNRAQDGDPRKATQVRASAATMLNDLVGSAKDPAVKDAAFSAYGKLVNGETDKRLKESMIFNAIQNRPFLNDAQRAEVDGWKVEIAPTTLPTDKWFADGKTSLNISYAAGHGEGFYEGVTEFFGRKGFKVVKEGGYNQPRRLQKKVQVNGQEREINIDLRHFSKDSFKEINNDNYDMLVYGGHSNLGGNTRASLENAPEGTGKDKLIFLGLCSGKDNLDGVRKAFPEAQVVTTFNSSYFNTRTNDAGNKQFYTGEDTKALNEIIEGAVKEKSWEKIGDNIRRNAVGYNHSKELGNYITPIDTQFAARFRDGDSDGQNDILDRHFNVDTIAVRAEPSNSFEAQDAADGKLNGDLPKTAAAYVNTVDLYNPMFDKVSHKGRVVADGFYRGGDNDPVVRFTTELKDGRAFYKMQVNRKFAHMDEESLRAVTMVEYSRHIANTEPQNWPTKSSRETELAAFVAGSASLKYDAGYNDRAVFAAMAEHYDLPEGTDFSRLKKRISNEHHDYTGSLKIAREWFSGFDADTQAAWKARHGE